jgi:hypothetical protein
VDGEIADDPEPVAFAPPKLPSRRRLLKVITGNRSASKKSADLRWASRSGIPVSMLATCIATSTQHPSGCSSSAVRVASISLNRPRTVVIIMCLTENSTLECAGSSLQVLVPVCAAVPMMPPRYVRAIRRRAAAGAIGHSMGQAAGVRR